VVCRLSTVRQSEPDQRRSLTISYISLSINDLMPSISW
jgi:hypothetical protein